MTVKRRFRQRGVLINHAQDTRQPETSGVGEQTFSRADDRAEVFGDVRLPAVVHKPPVVVASEPWVNRSTQANTPFIVGTVGIRVLPANPRRTYLLIQNKSADVMYLNFGQQADLYNGIQISAGGAYELIGGATGGSHCPFDDVFVLGGSSDLAGVVTEGMVTG